MSNFNNKKGGKIVYLGGIPFDFSEYDVLNIVNTVGTVVGIKLAFDQLTGKSKGYAFVEYADEDTAASAVRNLNNYQVGNRHLKCGFSSGSTISGNVTMVNPDGTIKITDDGSSNSNNNPSSSNSINNNKSVEQNNAGGNQGNINKNQLRKKRRLNSAIPPLPPGITVSEKDAVFNVISQTLKSLEQITLYNTIKDAKFMALRNPETMIELLDQCPQLSSALIEILLLFQLKSPEDVSALLSSEIQTTALGQQAAQPGTGAATNENATQAAPQTEPPQPQAQQQSEQLAQMPATQPDTAQPALAITDPEQLAAIKQVVQLTEEQVQSLPPDQREAIVQIQQNYKNGLYGAL